MRGRGMETQREQHIGSGTWAHRHIGGYNTNEEKFLKWSKARIPRVERWRKSRLHIETANWGCHRCLRCQRDSVFPSNSRRAGIRAGPAQPQTWRLTLDLQWVFSCGRPAIQPLIVTSTLGLISGYVIYAQKETLWSVNRRCFRVGEMKTCVCVHVHVCCSCSPCT